MADMVTLTCKTCNGKLQVTSDIDRFACQYCGTEYLVKRGGGLVSLAPIEEGIRQVARGVDKTASELAIQRLTSEIAELEKAKRIAVARAAPFRDVAWALALLFFMAAGALLILGLLDRPTLRWTAVAFIVWIAWMVLTQMLVNAARRRAAGPFDQQLRAKDEERHRHQELVRM